MNLLLASSFVLGSALYPANATQGVRINALKNYFDPPIGATAHVDPYELENAKAKDPLDLRGFFVFKG